MYVSYFKTWIPLKVSETVWNHKCNPKLSICICLKLLYQISANNVFKLRSIKKKIGTLGMVLPNNRSLVLRLLQNGTSERSEKLSRCLSVIIFYYLFEKCDHPWNFKWKTKRERISLFPNLVLQLKCYHFFNNYFVGDT